MTAIPLAPSLSSCEQCHDLPYLVVVGLESINRLLKLVRYVELVHVEYHHYQVRPVGSKGHRDIG